MVNLPGAMFPVRGLQGLLQKKGLPVGVTGRMDDATAGAIREAQRSHGLPETGLADAATVAALSAPSPPRLPPVDTTGRRGGAEPPSTGGDMPSPPSPGGPPMPSGPGGMPSADQASGAMDALRQLLTQGGMTPTNPVADFQRGFAGPSLMPGQGATAPSAPAPQMPQVTPTVAAGPRLLNQPPSFVDDLGTDPPNPPVQVAAGPQTLQKPTNVVGAMDAMRQPFIDATLPYAKMGPLGALQALLNGGGGGGGAAAPPVAPAATAPTPRINADAGAQQRWDARAQTMKSGGFSDAEIVKALGPRP